MRVKKFLFQTQWDFGNNIFIIYRNRLLHLNIQTFPYPSYLLEVSPGGTRDCNKIIALVCTGCPEINVKSPQCIIVINRCVEWVFFAADLIFRESSAAENTRFVCFRHCLKYTEMAVLRHFMLILWLLWPRDMFRVAISFVSGTAGTTVE